MNDDFMVAVDNGSSVSRAGFVGHGASREMFPAIVGRAKMPGTMVGVEQPDRNVGELQSKRCVLKLKHHIEHDTVKNWDHMENIQHHTFYNDDFRMTADSFVAKNAFKALKATQRRQVEEWIRSTIQIAMTMTRAKVRRMPANGLQY